MKTFIVAVALVAATATLAACGSTGGGRSGGGSTVTLLGCRNGYVLSSPGGDSYRCTSSSSKRRVPTYRLLCEPGYRIADTVGPNSAVSSYTCTKRPRPSRGDN